MHFCKYVEMHCLKTDKTENYIHFRQTEQQERAFSKRNDRLFNDIFSGRNVATNVTVGDDQSTTTSTLKIKKLKTANNLYISCTTTSTSLYLLKFKDTMSKIVHCRLI